MDRNAWKCLSKYLYSYLYMNFYFFFLFQLFNNFNAELWKRNIQIDNECQPYKQTL